MIGIRWLASPLAATATVMAILCLLAIPLRKLTSDTPSSNNSSASPSAPASNEIHAVLRLRLLAPAKAVAITTSNGKSLLEAQDLPVGESEHDATIPLHDGTLDLALRVDTGSDAVTAVFLTVMPDGEDDQTRYAIGSGKIREPLHYQWHAH